MRCLPDNAVTKTLLARTHLIDYNGTRADAAAGLEAVDSEICKPRQDV